MASGAVLDSDCQYENRGSHIANEMVQTRGAKRPKSQCQMPNAQIPNAKCSDAQMLKRSKCSNGQNAQMLKCSNAQMLKCSNAQMHNCSTAQTHQYSNAQMLKCSNDSFKSSNAHNASFKMLEYTHFPRAHTIPTFLALVKNRVSTSSKTLGNVVSTTCDARTA